ncbi:MAG: hypothetical protein HY897_21745 [Deltaproteobacteria bacterium]|nr:hypothetical protein [Deltaproteobacteria bacterium]
MSQPAPRFSRARWLWLAVAAAISIACALYAPGIPFSYDPTEYFPKDNNYVRFWLDLTRRFDGLSTLIIGLEEPEQSMTADGLGRLSRITNRLSDLKAGGVLWARSIVNVDSITETADGSLSAELLIPDLPGDAAGMDRIRARVKANTQVLGALVSRDFRAYLILLRTDPRKDSREVARLAQAVVEEERGPMPAYYFGAPFFANLVTSKVYDKLGWIASIFIAFMLLPLALRVRRLSVIALVLFSAGLPLLWWMGLLRLLGVNLTSTSLSAALFLPAAAAIAYARIAEQRLVAGRGPDSTMRAILVALVAIAGASLLASRASIPYLSQFCVALGFGFLMLAAAGLLFVAPALTFIESRPPPQPGPARTFRPLPAALCAFVILVAGAAAASHIRFYIAPEDQFSKDDEVGRMRAFFDRRFGGNDLIQVSVTADLRNPAAAARLMRFTDLADGSRLFSDVRSIAQVLGFLGHGFGGVHRIPPSREALGNLWFFLEGSSDVRSLVLDDRKEAMVIMRIPDGATLRPGQLADAVREMAKTSEQTGIQAAGRRVAALGKTYGVEVPDDRVERILAAAAAPPSPGARDALAETVLARLLAYLGSPDSPWQPDGSQWSAIASAIREDGGEPGARFAELAAGGVVPADLAETLKVREKDIRVAVRSAALAERLTDGATVPEAYAARLQGALADFIAPHPGNGSDVQFRVTGFPVLASGIAAEFKHGILAAAVLLLAACAALIFMTSMKPLPIFRAAVDAALATALTFALGWVLRVQMDSGSATLYLLPPVLSFLASPWLFAEDPPDRGRWAPAFAMGFSLSALSILVTTVLPTIRIGAAMAIGLAMILLVTTVSSRVQAEPK